MAKRKRKEQQPVEDKGDAYEPPSVSAADLSGPWDGANETSAPEASVSPADKNAEPSKPTRTQRAVEKLRSVMGRYFPRKKVELIDDFNAGGVGIKLTYDDPQERPSEEVKAILKAPAGNYSGLKYQGGRQQWRKRIGSDADPKTAVAIRMDAERRFEAVGEQMSHEERLKAERAEGDGPGEKTRS